VHPYHPYIAKALAEQRAGELAAAAASHRLAAAAAGRGASWLTFQAERSSRLSRLFSRRRYHQVELVWPDGVCSVVAAPPRPASEDPAGPLAGSRR
jgi:hypothetical protein